MPRSPALRPSWLSPHPPRWASTVWAVARVCTLLRMQRERLTVSLHPQTAARVRQCGARTNGGASAYLEHLVRQDAMREAVAAAASWYAAHPTYAAASEAETLAALDETA
jgi:hypothetical protein